MTRSCDCCPNWRSREGGRFLRLSLGSCNRGGVDSGAGGDGGPSDGGGAGAAARANGSGGEGYDGKVLRDDSRANDGRRHQADAEVVALE